jgi:hypothetical protein
MMRVEGLGFLGLFKPKRKKRRKKKEKGKKGKRKKKKKEKKEKTGTHQQRFKVCYEVASSNTVLGLELTITADPRVLLGVHKGVAISRQYMPAFSHSYQGICDSAVRICVGEVS